MLWGITKNDDINYHWYYWIISDTSDWAVRYYNYWAIIWNR